MNALKLRPGTKFEIELISSIDHEKVYVYASQLVDIIDESTIVIAAPMRRSRLITIPASTRLRLLFIDDNKDLVGFLGIVTQRADSGNVPSLVIKIDSELVKIQRRRHFRLDCLMDIRYAICKNAADNGESMYNPPAKEHKKAVSKNISGSGMCIVTNEELPEGTIIWVAMELDSDSHIDTMCKVVRCVKIDEFTKKSRYEIGLDFTCISPQDEEKLVKYIFSQQRELLKKGKGSLR